MASSRSRATVVAAFLASTPTLLAQVSGFVLDPVTSLPIADAMVSLQASDQRTTTDNSGMFSLPGVSGANLTIVVAKQGYYYASTVVTTPAPGVLLVPEQVTVGNNPNYAFVEPTTCAICHPDQFDQWNGSPMAKAGANTWVYDIYDGSGTPGGMGGFVYTRDSAFAQSNPESECAACHQPEPWVETPHSALEPIDALSTGAMHGISCEVCHKIAHIDETQPNYPGIWPGIVTLNRPPAPEALHQVEYGVLGDVSYESPGLMRASYQPQLVADVCAACHQDKNDPDEDGDFEEANGVISEPTYLEWTASPYSDPNSPHYATCVDCHMPSSDSQHACSVISLDRDPGTIRSHSILGTTPQYLENAADLAMSVQENGTSIAVSVDVANNQTGHHVPTGVTVRNVILLVEAWRISDGQRLAHTGAQTVHALGGVGAPELGYYGGMPGKLFAKHNHDAAGNGPTFFTDATGILFDTRIPALATDSTQYTFDIPPGSGTVRVRARLIYRRAFRGFVDAKQWTTDGHGNPLEDIAPPYYGHLMEEAAWTSAGPTELERYGVDCAGLTIGVEGTPFAGNPDFALTLSGAPPSVASLVMLGLSQTNWSLGALPFDLTPFGAPGCWILTSTETTMKSNTDANGLSRYELPIPFTGPWGVTFYVQWLTLTPQVPLGWSTSDAMRVTIQR